MRFQHLHEQTCNLWDEKPRWSRIHATINPNCFSRVATFVYLGSSYSIEFVFQNAYFTATQSDRHNKVRRGYTSDNMQIREDLSLHRVLIAWSTCRFIYLMRKELLEPSNIDGCTCSKGTCVNIIKDLNI